MLKYCLLFIFIMLCISVNAMILPFNNQEVISTDNCIDSFVRVDPDDQKQLALSTKCWLWYDEDNLYVKVIAEIDSTFIIGQSSSKDDGTNADFIRIQLITFPESYYAYSFVAYPLGNLIDGIRNSKMGIDHEWNSDYFTESSYNDSLWTVKITIPFKDIRFTNVTPYKWKVIMTRYCEKNKETYSAPYANIKMNKDYFRHSTDITLQHQIRKNRNWVIKPYYVKSYNLIDKSSSFDPDNIGIDLSFNPNQKTKLKVTIRPDFSDTPMDSPQDNYNSKYPPSYSENRFFFIEDIEAFGMLSEFLDTRQIVKPDIAIKLTGNTNSYSYGLLFAKDQKTIVEGQIVNSGDTFNLLAFNPHTRHAQFYNTFMSRSSDNYYNYLWNSVYKQDIVNWLNVKTSLAVSTKDDDREEQSEPHNGYVAYTLVTANPGDWEAEAGYCYLSKDFNADLGSIYDTGIQNVSASLEWTNSVPAPKYYKYASISAWVNNARWREPVDRFYDTSYGSNGWVKFNENLTISFSDNGSVTYEDDNEHTNWNSNVGLGYYKFKSLGINITYGSGKSYIYSYKQMSVRRYVMLWFQGNISRYISYYGSITRMHYNYPRSMTFIDDDGTSYTVSKDDLYGVGNGSLSINFNNNVSLRNGWGLSTYHTSDSPRANVTFYSNLRYEFKQNNFIYIGYKTSQYQMVNETWNNFGGDFYKAMSSAYVKVSLAL